MYQYLILQNPGHNRVYYNAAGKMALAELQLTVGKLSVYCENAEITTVAGVRYLSFITADLLKEEDVKSVARLSFVFALFLIVEVNNEELLQPVLLPSVDYLDNKISSLLKYSGKTNELFTKMMINVALLSSDFNCEDSISLLDPVSGRGTTLFESAVYGFHSFGIEIDPKSVQESILFFKKYIQTERYKNQFDKRMVSGKNKLEANYIQEFEYATNKDDFKNVDNRKKLGVVCGNSAEADKYFKKNSMHLIVGDLPYGIAHGNTAQKKSGSITRNPSELLKLCIPQWSKLLKKGGVVVVAWNAFVVSKHQLKSVFEECGLQVLSDQPYDQFEHMVDKSIKRDIIVAKKLS